jgi:hypothetical protein
MALLTTVLFNLLAMAYFLPTSCYGQSSETANQSRSS